MTLSLARIPLPSGEGLGVGRRSKRTGAITFCSGNGTLMAWTIACLRNIAPRRSPRPYPSPEGRGILHAAHVS
jgi:hypothetical protein